MTVAGLLIGGAGTAIQLGAPAPSGDKATSVDESGFPTGSRDAAVDRASRADTRATAPAPTASAGSTKPRTYQVAASGTCEASYYDTPQPTADGEMFDPDGLTAANRTLPFGTRVRVTNLRTGRSVIVRINDRGPYIDGRCLDLSRAAFGSIAKLGAGVIDVRYEVLVQDAT